MPVSNDVLSWRGQELRSRGDDKLGTIEEIYLDTSTQEPEWALITTGLFGSKQSFVPLCDASQSDAGISVPFDKATVKDAPQIDPDGELSRGEGRPAERSGGGALAGGGDSALPPLRARLGRDRGG